MSLGEHLGAGRPANALIRARAMLGGPALAQHGIQRSGTNYLLCCLSEPQCQPLNTFNGRRDHPSHKHFRWQPEKWAIRLDPTFANRRTVENVAALNRSAGSPGRTRHVVMQKTIAPWAVSFVNWGLKCRWWTSADEAIGDLRNVFVEYHCYYSGWSRLRDRSEDRIEILDFEEVRQTPHHLPCALARLGIHVPPSRADGFRGRFAVVAQSPPSRADFLSAGLKRQVSALVSELAAANATAGAFGGRRRGETW